MLLTKHSTFRLKEKQEERGSVQTLINIPLRSMLINGRRDTIKNSQTERSETLFKNASTGTRKSTTRDFDLLVFNHLANHNWYANYATHPIAHDEMTWHAGRYKQLM